MPINTNLNVYPYYDDFDIAKQFHKILFVPERAVQVRELIQLQTILQNQIEQFGDNIFQEGSIIKGCNFTELNDLSYVKVKDVPTSTSVNQFDPTIFIGEVLDSGEEYQYEIEGQVTGLRASIISASRGFETRSPDLNTFYIRYLNTNDSQEKTFQAGEELHIRRIRLLNDEIQPEQSGDNPVVTINVTNLSNPTGSSFGLRVSEGIIFQKGHFLFAEEQLIIISKYTSFPDQVGIGYTVSEELVSHLQDNSLYDNASGFTNKNAPGADRLKLIPILIKKDIEEAEEDNEFFVLIKYESGNAVQIRDVSQYNSLGEEFARRTYEESGNYIQNKFTFQATRNSANNELLQIAISPGVAYVKGFRVENHATRYVDILPISETRSLVNQPISFQYGNYVNISAINGKVPIDGETTVNLKNSGNSVIGTALVKNITPSRLYLYQVNMIGSNSFSNVVKVSGTSGEIIFNSNTILQEKNSSEFVFESGTLNLANTTNITLPKRVSKSVSITGDTFNLIAEVGQDFDVEQEDMVLVDSTDTFIDISSYSVSTNKETLTINLVGGQSPAATGTLYYNIREQLVEPYTKVTVNTYIKSLYNSNTSVYNLGFPDVQKIISIYDVDGIDVTSSFRLVTNQKDHYYDHSYIEYIPNTRRPSNGLMTVNLECYKINDTTGQAFFTVASYSDVNIIPSYTTSTNKTYNLRECFDMRPYVTELGNYNVTDAGSAPTINPAINITPSYVESPFIPALSSSGQYDVEYYLNRVDLLTVDSYGRFSFIRGEEADYPAAPTIDTADQMALCRITIPGYPALSPEEASIQKKFDYSVQLKPVGTEVQTMKDISDMKERIEQLSYYVTLSQLEAETQNLNILDENGLSRFKNGIIVDSFSDLSVANIEHPEYNAAIDFTEKTIGPSVMTVPLNIRLKESSNVTIYPDTIKEETASLQKGSQVAFISQKYANSFRNCVSNYYSYKGNGYLSPEYDMAYDTQTNPAHLDFDFYGPIKQFADNLQEIVPLTRTDTMVLSDETRKETVRTKNHEWVYEITDTVLRDKTKDLQISSKTNTQKVGDFVTNFKFQPYMRSREIRIFMSGLRPNTRHYFYFDQQDVNAHVVPGDHIFNTAKDIRPYGKKGQAVKTDSKGILRALFHIPPKTFFVGDRKLEIVDVDSYSSIESASTSYGSVMYRAYNFSVEKTSLTSSTRVPETTIKTTSSTRSVSQKTLIYDKHLDPLAQTFFIKKGMGLSADSVFISSLDLYFKRKGQVNGVTVMIREVLNGYPAAEIIPFTKTHLTSDEVNVSNDGSAKTTISFRAPIRLNTEKEYCIVIEPDGNDPDYLIFTSKVGENDYLTGAPVVQDWGDGTLFTSTNNRAWKSYQDEDIKFTLYRHDFPNSDGYVTFTNDNHEFLKISNTSGRWQQEEIVYAEKELQGNTGLTVGGVSGNTEITGTSLSDTYVAGDKILVEWQTEKYIHTVTSVSAGTMTLDSPINFTGSANAKPIVTGNIVYFDPRNLVSRIILENSSANSTKSLQVGNTIHGFTSNTSCTITEVENFGISYFQAMISRTNDSATRTNVSGVFTKENDPLQTITKNLSLSSPVLFNDGGAIIVSRSNDIAGSKAFDLKISLSNLGNRTTTPFIDLETATILGYQFKITDDSATTSKYVSKIIELADGMDAEDFHIYLTGYRPRGTNFRVYLKAQNGYDPASFDSNPWNELDFFEGSSLFSSSVNLNDFREFRFRLSENNKSSGAFRYTNSFGTFSNFNRFSIKIEFLSETPYNVPRLADYRGMALT